MTKRITIIALLVAFVSVEASAQNRTHRRRGVLLGGLAGAAIGAAIGDKGDNETAGALIGGAVGAVAGGTIGNQKDQRIEHNRRYHSGHGHYTYPQHSAHQQSYYQQGSYPAYRQGAPIVAPVEPAPPVAQPVTPNDVVAMMQSGLSEQMIIQQIQLNGAARALTVGEIIQLHDMGASEAILNEMQVAAFATTNPQVNLELPPPPPQPAYGPSIVAPSNLAPSNLAPSNGQ